MPTDDFDPYYKWLGIPPEEQPPDHYRLLGIRTLETDADVIAHAADRQMAHVRTFQSGPHAEHSQRMLNEISAARLCLHVPETKAAYDEALKSRRRAQSGDWIAEIDAAVPHAPPPLPQPQTAIAATVGHSPEPGGEDDESVSREGWGWKAVVAALCVGLAAVAIAWKIRVDRREAEAQRVADEQHEDQRDEQPGEFGPSQPGLGQSRNPPRPSSTNSTRGSATGNPGGRPAVTEMKLPELPGAFDLLVDVDPVQHAVQGQWHREGAVLVSPACRDPSYAILKLPAALPPEYVLALLVERVEGRDALAINFPIADHRAVIVLDSSVGGRFADSPVSGIDRIDGRQYYQNDTKRQGRTFAKSKPYLVLCEIRTDSVRVTVDGKQIIDWHGEPFRLSVGRQWQAQGAQGVVLGSYRTAYRFLQVAAAPLASD